MCHLLDKAKATGPDGISARMLKETASTIAPSVTELFNLSLHQQTFPSQWKYAKVVPIPKNSASKSSPNNYRPISLLPIVSKVFEKYIHSIISDHLDENCPIPTNQWGFQSGKSTTTALISTIHIWLNALDSGNEIATVFFDFKKAFDTVPHSLLIDKLRELQLHPCVIEWISNYLTKRSQSVVINGSTSQPMTIKSGVPQGSVLGPLLFLIYISSICDLPLSSRCRLVLYADDLVLFKVTQTSADFLEFQNDINKIVRWVDANLLTLNSSKCKCMLLTRKTTIMTPLYLGTCSDIIQEVKSYKYLGVLITADLRWDVHISGICLKAKRLLGLLYRKFYRSFDSAFLFRLYLSLVRPILEYACPVWDPYTFKNIEQVQKFALKICAHRWDTGYCTGHVQHCKSRDTEEIFKVNNFLQNCQWHHIFS